MALTLHELPVPDAVPRRPRLSVVVPAYDESATIRQTLARLARVGTALEGGVEVVVVSDGSRDDTYEIARHELARGLDGTLVELAANAGSHAAIRCGLRYATGEHVAVLAGDGQDPPEALPAMLAALRAPVDVVWGRRRDRTSDGRATRLLAALFYRLFRLLTGLDFPPAGLDFLVARRAAVLALLDEPARNTSLFLTLFNLGFVQAYVDYDRGARAGGCSSWTLRKRVKLGLDMVTGCSAAPVRLIAGAGIAVGGLGVLGGATVLAAGGTSAGWAWLMVLTSVLAACVLLALALLGEYVWRALDEVRAGPLFREARLERFGPPEGAP